MPFNIMSLPLFLAVIRDAQELLGAGECRLYPYSGGVHICRTKKWLDGSYKKVNERSKQLPVWGSAEWVDSKARTWWPDYIWEKETETICSAHNNLRQARVCPAATFGFLTNFRQ